MYISKRERASTKLSYGLVFYRFSNYIATVQALTKCKKVHLLKHIQKFSLGVLFDIEMKAVICTVNKSAS